MGRKGWAGTPPADDHEARKRIVNAAIASIERRGPQRSTMSDIAADLGVTRPTIYRHFASTEDLLAAAAEVALDGWTARIGELTKGMDDAADLLVEAVAYLIERLPEEPLLALLLETDRMRLVSRQMVMPAAVQRSRIMLEHTHIDWAAQRFQRVADGRPCRVSTADDSVDGRRTVGPAPHRRATARLSTPLDRTRSGVTVQDFQARQGPSVMTRRGAPRQSGRRPFRGALATRRRGTSGTTSVPRGDPSSKSHSDDRAVRG